MIIITRFRTRTQFTHLTQKMETKGSAGTGLRHVETGGAMDKKQGVRIK